VLVDASQLSLAACAAALSLEQPDKATEWLVEGRCIVWNQINQLRTPVDELRSYDEGLAERLSILSRQLEGAGLRTDPRGKQTELSMDDNISLEDEARMHLKHAKDWEELLNTIRNIPKFKDFLRPRKCTDIMSNLSEAGPIIIINIHSDRCDALALIAGAETPLHIPLPNFSHQEAERLANGLRSYLLSFGVRSRLGLPFADDGSPCSDINLDFPMVLKVLWSIVVGPILQALGFSVCSTALFDRDLHSRFPSRYRTRAPKQSCPAYGGAQLGLLPFFQSTQQASTSRVLVKAFLGSTCRSLLSRHTFRP